MADIAKYFYRYFRYPCTNKLHFYIQSNKYATINLCRIKVLLYSSDTSDTFG